MQALRRSTFLAGLVLAWFALLLAAGIAAPIVHPQAAELVCQAGGLPRLVVTGPDGSAVELGTGHHSLDCPLCLAAMLPVSVNMAWGRTPLPGLARPPRFYTSWISAIHAAALPARGPPARPHPHPFA